MPKQPESGPHELYIYYRVPAATATALQPRVQAVMADLCVAHPGLQARLLRRPVAAGAAQTWMEIWRAESGIDAALRSRIESAAAPLLVGAIEGERHVEVFEPLDTPLDDADPA